MMKIHNFRAGFATNSSSSHSVILLPVNKIGKVDSIDGFDDHYGWDWFRLTTVEEKMRYLCAQMFTVAGDEETRKHIVERLKLEAPELEHVSTGETEWGSVELGIDHQSVWGFSSEPETMETLIKFFKSPRVVILGGNDNADHDDYNAVPGAEKVPFIRDLAREDSNGKVVMKTDGDFMIAFNREDGTKLRYSLDRPEAEYTKANVPELVDLKITNYCDAGCKFCYQSSTIKGKHAPFETIKQHVDMLAEMGVFEIAIGGGEPTEHPQFLDILLYIHSKGIVPNFTTFSDKWLENVDMLDVVKLTVGGIGVSVHDAAGLELVERIESTVLNWQRKVQEKYAHIKAYRWKGPMVMAQHVVGSVPIGQTGEFIDAAFGDEVPILLLGYKSVGFGKGATRYDQGEVSLFLKMALLNKAKASVSVDTALVDQFPDLMAALGVPKALVSSPEGKFSCYVDAVTGRMGPSSYVEPKTMTPVPSTTDEFKSVFATY